MNKKSHKHTTTNQNYKCMRKSNTPISQNILTRRIYIYRGRISLLKSPITQLQSCPDHLNIAEFPVAKSLGLATNGVTLVKTVGRRSHLANVRRRITCTSSPHFLHLLWITLVIIHFIYIFFFWKLIG